MFETCISRGQAPSSTRERSGESDRGVLHNFEGAVVLEVDRTTLFRKVSHTDEVRFECRDVEAVTYGYTFSLVNSGYGADAYTIYRIAVSDFDLSVGWLVAGEDGSIVDHGLRGTTVKDRFLGGVAVSDKGGECPSYDGGQVSSSFVGIQLGVELEAL